MKKIVFGPEGYPLYFYDDATYPPTKDGNENPGIPSNAVDVTNEQWVAAAQGMLWRSQDGVLGAPPAEEIKKPIEVTSVPAVTLWERMTEAEAEQVNAAMATQPFRTRQIFLTANTFRSDHELWPLLESMAADLFGETRAAELLADPSELVANP
jgi:hypothetical protein